MKTEFTIEEIKERLASLKPDIIPAPEHQRPASVLVPFYENENGLSLVFMMRPDYPGVHGGQISFPGGKRGEADKDNLSTALRETQEEIGIKRNDIEVWGRLSTFQTRTSDFCVTPFVGRIPYPYEFRPDPEEVDRLIIVPFSYLLDPKNSTFGDFVFKGYSFPSYMFSYKKDVIWGFTARILNSFITFLRTGQESY
jgi:8-oxo-dGTP pyrophosphatase MutT (NUDIX family)